MQNKTRILVVDDNQSLVRIIEALLERRGYEVLTAFDGMEGLDRAREAKPDLIILDIVMPRLDGYEVCRLLQNNVDTAAIPILMLTAKGQVDDPDIDDQTLDTRIQERMAGFDVGAIDFISKPVKAKELEERVKSLLWLDGISHEEDS